MDTLNVSLYARATQFTARLKCNNAISEVIFGTGAL